MNPVKLTVAFQGGDTKSMELKHEQLQMIADGFKLLAKKHLKATVDLKPQSKRRPERQAAADWLTEQAKILDRWAHELRFEDIDKRRREWA
jgi:hypothetical protein